MQNINMKRCTTKKEIDKQFFEFVEVPQTCFSKEVMDRKQKKEKENTCDRNEKTRRKKRQQMNKCMSKRRT